MSYWIVGDRQSGKTTAALKWFMRGHPVDHSPGWSRVFVVSHGSTMRGYIRDLLGKLWVDEGREGKPPFSALVGVEEVFAYKHFRGRTQELKNLTYVIDDFASTLQRGFTTYHEVLSQITVEVFTMDGYPLPEELTPSQFIALLDSTPTEEST